MKKIHLITCLLVLITVLLSEKSFAGQAYPHPMQVNQADGTVLTVILQGDERIKWAKTIDGYTLLYNDAGIYEYGKLDPSGNLIPSGMKANDIAKRTSSEISFLATTSKNIFYSRSQTSVMLQISNILATDGVTAFPTTGTRKLLCILIGYTDLAFTETQANFNNLFNQVGYGTYGSVKDYYEENSYGQFHLTVDVAGPYTASNTKAYYGANNASGDDIRPKELVTEAVILADPDVNYADYDNDGDNIVDGIYVIYAGYNEAENGGADCIWYHAWNIFPLPLDGKIVSSYSCSAEYKGNSGSNISGIGNICHEFGHVMGAPDFYDTDYGNSGGKYPGLGLWCCMASGNFNGDRDCPAHYNPYIKYIYFGWVTPTTISSQAEMTLHNSTQNSDQFYIYNSPTTPGEFFMIENQQQIGFDAEVPGHGLIVYHAHQNLLLFGSDNTTHPQRFYPVCANAGTEPSTTPADYGDINSMDTPFPGAGGKTAFTDATVPSSRSWAGANTGKPIEFITEDNTAQTIDLCFMCCPEANFIADVTDPCVGIPVDFTDLSEYPTSWLWSFSPTTVSYYGGTTSGSQNPRVKFNDGGNYTVTLTATNACGSDAEVKTDYIYVHTAPVVTTHPANNDAEWGDNVAFTAAASGDPTPSVQWWRSTDGGSNYQELGGATSPILSISCVTLDMSGYEYYAIFTNKCGDDWTDIAVLTVTPKTVATAITVIPNPQQYSDLVDISVGIADGYTCGEYAATGADIFIGTQYMGTVSFAISGSDLVATLYNVALLEPTPWGTSPTGQMAPGVHAVTAVLSGVSSNFSISNTGTPLTIECEDADVIYTGGEFFTANPNNGDFTAALDAFIADVIDASRGDIRHADVTFREENELGAVLGTPNIPVGLIDYSNFQEGFVTTDINGTLNNGEQSGGGRIYEVWAGAGNYYCGDIETPVVVSITMPGGEYVTGGGHIVMTNTSGLYPGLNNAGKKMNFGLVMKWNKSGKNLQGKVNVIYRGVDGYNYKIKSNAIKSLSVETVDEGDLTFNKATISTKANLKKLMPEGALSLGGNLSLIVTAWECTSVNTGEFDRISVQLAGNGGSGIWFTSHWGVSTTMAQTLDGGKIQVGMNNYKSEEIDITETGQSQIYVYPNPSSGPLTFEFQLEESSKATLDVYSTSGRMVSRLFEGEVKSGELRTIHYNEFLSQGVYYYILRTDKLVKTGKFIRTLK